MDTLVEKVARAICEADGVDPDQIGSGMGYAMPRGIDNYRMWEARKKQASAAIYCILQGETPIIMWPPEGEDSE